MRSILFSLLLLISTASFAQKFELGINDGIAWNTKPLINDIHSNNYRTVSPNNNFASLKLMYNFKKWQVGLSVSQTNISYQLGYSLWMEQSGGFNYWQSNNIGKPLTPAIAFINRKCTYKKLETYFGLSAGYVFAHTGETTLNPTTNEEHFFTTNANGKGFTAGAQIGNTWYFKKHLGINAELSANYTYLRSGDVNYKLFIFPATVGIRYRL